jgi:hypothetical protein
MARKYIMVPVKEVDKYVNMVCKYVFKKGESIGNVCYVRNYCNGYCKKHFKLIEKTKIKKEKCAYITKNGNCNRSCEDGKNTCKYHKEGSNCKIVQNENEKKKMKKKLKRIKYKQNKKFKNSKINKDIKIEYINEGTDIFGFLKSNKRKSPFPNEEIIIDNTLYKNSYYEWSAVNKNVKIYCINKENKDNKKIFIYSINQFEEILSNIYTKETVNRYFDIKPPGV